VPREDDDRGYMVLAPRKGLRDAGVFTGVPACECASARHECAQHDTRGHPPSAPATAHTHPHTPAMHDQISAPLAHIRTHTNARAHTGLRLYLHGCAKFQSDWCTHTRTRTHTHPRTHARAHAGLRVYLHGCAKFRSDWGCVLGAAGAVFMDEVEVIYKEPLLNR
jgi:hypothetical protein